LNNANQIKKNFLNYQAGKFITKKEFLLILKKLIDKNVEYFLVKNIDSKIKLTDYVTKYLEKNDHNLVFLSPGDENLHLLDSIGRNEKINFISSYNEKSVCIAAEAYSVVSKKTGVVIVSSGASSIEIFNSIANSWIESSNIIYISGQAVLSEDKFLRQSGNKSFNLVNSVKDITKYAVTINNPNEIKFHLEKAFYQSRYGRFGPSLIEIPIDLQGSIINEINLKLFIFKNDFFKASYKKKELLKIQTTLKLLKKSLRPVIIIGKGIKLSNAENELKNFISQAKIPILTSKNGADLIEDSHKLYFGRPGAYGQRSANFIIQNSDLILSIGCRLTPTFIGRANNFFARGAKKIVVDIDSNELAKKSIKINLKIHLDAKIFLLAIGKKISSLNLNFDNWMKQCKKYKLLFIDNKYNVPTIKKLKLNNNNIYPLYLFDTISRYFKNDDIIVVDNNGPLMQFLLAFKFKKNQKLISSSSLEPKGFSIAASIGASFFKKHNFIYCISEVNGFQKSLQDLQTIKDYNLPIKIILLIKDDNSVIKSTQKIFFGDRYVGTDKNSKYDVASLLKISKSNGFDIFKMYKNHSVKEKLDEFFLNKKSSILAIKVKHDQDLISKQGFIVGSDNKLIPRPLEDMQPYVSRSFLKKHMLIDIVDK
jgi:acetolactate synthase-1/2/3 large subunit